MLETQMTLHVDSSTIRNQGVLAHVLDPVDASTERGGGTATDSSTDSASISSSGLRLAAIDNDHADELNAVADAESLVRSLAINISGSTNSSALHRTIDRSRAAALLVD
jgi:hypothetical protein